ncbi:hypothetical protein BD410DRAFT_799362 [Rickenella mellea]|uniref:DUF4939 domain-containing protein n=1 Tax=Rickenella mellea TaxID=50990 RepID=A0A4Y7QK14_9AGAM|nr:hypothetical protein BD410DRAFT_799362 [Rickenella mellea]
MSEPVNTTDRHLPDATGTHPNPNYINTTDEFIEAGHGIGRIRNPHFPRDAMETGGVAVPQQTGPLPPQTQTAPAQGDDPSNVAMTILDLQRQIAEMLYNQTQAIQAVGGQAPRPAAAPAPKMPKPEEFSGSPEKVQSFLRQCSLYFDQYPGISNYSQVRTALSFMRGGTAGRWAER